MKASSENPNFLFQQIRHPRQSGGSNVDYDLLLCLGVSAGSLEWWAIPTAVIDSFAENGLTTPDRVVITLHHGKRRPIWNHEHGFENEGWFRADPRVRAILAEFACSRSDQLRELILQGF